MALEVAGGYFFFLAHKNSGFNTENPKPNSLVYFFDTDDNAAYWGTYDHMTDDWTDVYLSEADTTGNTLKTIFGSKYGTKISKTQKTYIKPLKQPFIEVQKDTVTDGLRHMNVFVSPQRLVHRYEIFAKEHYKFSSLKINGLPFDEEHIFIGGSDRLVNFYLARDKSIEIEFSIDPSQEVQLDFYEISYDLLTNELFDVKPRPSDMIPKPFVVNDAVIIKKSWSSHVNREMDSFN